MRRILLLSSAVLLLATACKKELKVNDNTPTIDKNATRFPVTKKEKERAENAKLLVDVFKNIYPNKQAMLELNAALKSGVYKDELVPVAALVNMDKALYQNKRFQQLNAPVGAFAKAFATAYEKVTGKKSPVLAQNTFDDYYNLENVSVYFPYMEEFVYPLDNSTITLTPTDREADNGEGFFFDQNTNTWLTETQVDDLYAMQYPVYIIGYTMDDLTPLEDIQTDPPPPPGYVATSVFTGAGGNLQRQYDHLISFTGNGGGSEIVINRISGYLTMVNQQITSFAGDGKTVYFTRRDIRKGYRKEIMATWDADWLEKNDEQIYAVWEDDTEATKEFNGTLSTTVKIPISGGATIEATRSIGFKVAVKSQDEILTQTKMPRRSYFTMAKEDRGCGFDPMPRFGENWPLWDCGTNWTYSWPYKVY